MICKMISFRKNENVCMLFFCSPKGFSQDFMIPENVMKAFEAGEKISWGFGKCRDRMLTF